MALESAIIKTAAPTVALIGGGYTLQRVAKLLAPKSFVLTSRDDTTCAAWRSQGWLSAKVSLHDKASIEKLFRDYPTISVVVDSVPPLREGDATAGVRALTEVLQGTNVRRIIYLSTTGVFGVRDGSEVTEETPPAPWNSQGAARLDSEEVYRHYVAVHSAVTFTALRLPAIYGSDRGVAHSIRAGSYALVEDGSFWTNRIHVDDLASVIAASVLYEGGLPGVLCVSDDEPTLAKDVAAYVCKREGLPYPSSVSREDVERRGGYTMLSNQRVRNERMKQLLNIQLRYPSFREGIYSQ